jgi:hypothetical protein
MKIRQRWRNRLALTIIALVAVLFLTTLPAQTTSVSQTPTGDVELLRFSTKLTLDGKPYTVVDGKLVPAGDVTRQGSMFPPSGVHTFTRSNPSWNFGDANGTGAEQINYSTNYEQWGYKLTPALQRIIVGNVQQAADLYHYNTRRSYGTHNVPPDYQFHGSMPGIEARGTYSTTFRATFRHNIGPGGNGVLSAQWNWQRR